MLWHTQEIRFLCSMFIDLYTYWLWSFTSGNIRSNRQFPKVRRFKLNFYVFFWKIVKFSSVTYFKKCWWNPPRLEQFLTKIDCNGKSKGSVYIVILVTFAFHNLFKRWIYVQKWHLCWQKSFLSNHKYAVLNLVIQNVFFMKQ